MTVYSLLYSDLQVLAHANMNMHIDLHIKLLKAITYHERVLRLTTFYSIYKLQNKLTCSVVIDLRL